MCDTEFTGMIKVAIIIIIITGKYMLLIQYLNSVNN